MLYLKRTKGMLENLGMTVTAGAAENGQESLNATIETKRGTFSVFAIAEGARLLKPNGTSKYLYECTDGRLSAVVRQTIKANS